MYKIDIVDDVSQFRDMRDEWNYLLSRSTTDTIFLTWEWLFSWWEIFGDNNKLFIITVRNNTNELIGIAPLFVHKTHFYKFPVRELSFIGLDHSDRQNFIVAEDDNFIFEHIFLIIFKNQKFWDIVRLDQIPEDQLYIPKDTNKKFFEVEDSSLCPYVEIAGDWDKYFKRLSKKFRKDIRNKSNRISRFGAWEFITTQKLSDVDASLKTIVGIERESQKKGTQKEFMNNKKNLEFIKRFIASCKDYDWIDLSIIKVNKRPIAYLLGFKYDLKYFAYNTAYDKNYHKASPGKILLNEKIKWCFCNQELIKSFDFLRGDFYIKSLWSKTTLKHKRLFCFKFSFYSVFLK